VITRLISTVDRRKKATTTVDSPATKTTTRPPRYMALLYPGLIDAGLLHATRKQLCIFELISLFVLSYILDVAHLVVFPCDVRERRLPRVL